MTLYKQLTTIFIFDIVVFLNYRFLVMNMGSQKIYSISHQARLLLPLFSCCCPSCC
jgi:hypothetical protein